MQTPRWIRLAGQSASANSPAILSGIAVAGVIATVTLAVRATPAVLRLIRELEDEKWANGGETLMEKDEARNNDLSRTEIVKSVWHLYIPAGVAGIATISCVIGANKIGARRNAALVGAYSLVDTAFREYKDEVVRQIGNVKERKVTDQVAVNQMERNPVVDSQVIITGGGEQLCYDSLTGRYFRSDTELIRRAENEINRRVVNDMYASHNEFYELLGLAPTTIGDELGWNIDNFIEIILTAHLAQDGVPCLAIGYVHMPRKDYGKF